jgi:3D (Asp-Asp-Asp) domain-containing protein
LLHHDQGVSWRANTRIIPAARRAVLSLPLFAIILLAGPVNAAPGSSANHAARTTKAISAGRTTSSSGARQALSSSHKSLSATHKTLTANASTHPSHVASDSPPTTTRPQVKQAHITPSTKAGSHLIGEARLPAATPPPAPHVTRPAPPKQPARIPLGTFMVTCYDLTGHTATGALVGPESVAVDPSVIPLGTRIYVPGIGERSADDTGGLIIGDHIDIWEPTYSQCADWGARYVPIYRLG